MKVNKNYASNKHDIEEYMLTLAENNNKVFKNYKKYEKLEFDHYNDQIHIPLFNEYSFLYKYNYNLNQLKMFVKHYKLKITGNKTQLINRLFFHLYFSFFANKIQKKMRGIIQRNYNNYHGPAYNNRSLCVNQTDFLTVDDIKDIPLEQFFSFKDDDGFVYGFDILSLHNLIYKSNGIIKNPYNRRPITNVVVENLRNLLRLSKTLNICICTDISEISNEITQEKSLELRILTLFQEIDSLGNYTNASWFTSLNRSQLIKFARELLDIWTFRSELSQQMKILISPPLGNPFPRSNFINYLSECQNIENMQKHILEVLEKIVNISAIRENRSLGAYYVLGALTLVNPDASNSLPWLYQSFCYTL
jgi:hypothetical protein